MSKQRKVYHKRDSFINQTIILNIPKFNINFVECQTQKNPYEPTSPPADQSSKPKVYWQQELPKQTKIPQNFRNKTLTPQKFNTIDRDNSLQIQNNDKSFYFKLSENLQVQNLNLSSKNTIYESSLNKLPNRLPKQPKEFSVRQSRSTQRGQSVLRTRNQNTDRHKLTLDQPNLSQMHKVLYRKYTLETVSPNSSKIKDQNKQFFSEQQQNYQFTIPPYNEIKNHHQKTNFVALKVNSPMLSTKSKQQHNESDSQRGGAVQSKTPKRSDQQIILNTSKHKQELIFKRKSKVIQQRNDSQSTNYKNILSSQLNSSQGICQSQESLIRAMSEQDKQEDKVEINKNIVALSQEFQKNIEYSLNKYLNDQNLNPLYCSQEDVEKCLKKVQSPRRYQIQKNEESRQEIGKIENLCFMDFEFDENNRNDSSELLIKLREKEPVPGFKRRKPKLINENF